MSGAPAAASGQPLASPPLSARRRAILDAALDVFSAKSVSSASIDDIRVRSGASVGSIYHHFGDKEGIAGALYVEGLSSYQESFLEALETPRATRRAVEAVVHRHLRWVARNRALARFLFTGRDSQMVLRTRSPLRELNRRFFAEVAQWVDPRVARGELCELEFPVRYALWIGPSQELSRHWVLGRSRDALEQAGPLLATAAWNAIKGQET